MMFTAQPTSHSFISQRLRLHYVDWGNPSAPPLVLVHGGRDHCRSWDWVADRLRHDWHVVAPDLRGHGDSAWSPDGDYTLPSYIYDLAQFIHQLSVPRVTLIAHSLGGVVSLRYAGIYPAMLEKLVVIEGIGPTEAMLAHRAHLSLGQRWQQWINERRGISGRSPRRYATFDDALKRMRSENTYLSEEQAAHLTANAASRNEDGSWSWKFDNYMHLTPPVDLSSEEISSLWNAIDCPTLLCHGDRSHFADTLTDGRLAHFRHARLARFAQAGHWPQHDAFEAFVAEVQQFLGTR
jgi:pimeloyl-ACP methyl ester carboxylesterase